MAMKVSPTKLKEIRKAADDHAARLAEAREAMAATNLAAARINRVCQEALRECGAPPHYVVETDGSIRPPTPAEIAAQQQQQQQQMQQGPPPPAAPPPAG